MKLKIRKPFDRDRVQKEFRDSNGDLLQPCIVEQHHTEMCQISNILKAYDRTGLITHVNNARAHYGDYTKVNEYQDSLNLVMQAQEDFALVPSAIREKFSNDPGQFMEFVTNPDNKSEMIEMGLAEAPHVQEPIPVDVVTKAPPEAE